ncbi:MAG: hypothetical protein ACFFD7_09930 [Candidatus Thorarchaeota archaeon]
MLREIAQFYKVGKELGLKKGEIHQTFINSGNRSLLFKLLLIFSLSLIAVFVIIAIFTASRSVYPSGTLYSSVMINDFKHRK